MRVEHAFIPTLNADPCARCGELERKHRKKRASRADSLRAWRAKRKGRKPGPPRKRKETLPNVLGIDGEGYTLPSGKHRYTYLCASSSDGAFVSDVYDGRGLRTKQVLEFLARLPKGPLLAGFSLGYDYTKWLEDLPDREIWLLYRPEKRPGRNGPRPRTVNVEGNLFRLDLVSTRLRVSARWNSERRKFRDTRTVWDLFKFFQRAFVASLEEWGVGLREEIRAIQKMKLRRGNFRRIGEREKKYCQDECRLLAKLAEKLISSCKEAGIPLRDYFGAGSLGAATLQDGPAKLQSQRNRIPASMRRAVSCAFFGGRFEQCVRGPINLVWGYDLASAYPYAECHLPCLAHGRWKHVKSKGLERAIRKAPAACVRYTLPPRADIASQSYLEAVGPDVAEGGPLVGDDARVTPQPWGPFPFRLSDGSILFPTESEGGWIWKEEFLAAKDCPRLWPNVRALEAWVFVPERCKCPKRPFLDEVTRFYRERQKWGKDAKGLVLKKGLASRYGKRAQTIGRAPFSCPIAAGMITSHTRAEILRFIAAMIDPRDVLSIATDGVLTRCKVGNVRKPSDTGTHLLGKALGTWEEKAFPGGVFFMRPGMRFSLDLREKEGTTAARGVGVRALHKVRKRILNAWKKDPHRVVKVARGTVFYGAKVSIGEGEGGKVRRLRTYGRWGKADPFKVSPSPLPKRPAARRDHTLLTWALAKDDGESSPYDAIAARMRAEVQDLREADDLAECQPEGWDAVGEEDT